MARFVWYEMPITKFHPGLSDELRRRAEYWDKHDTDEAARLRTEADYVDNAAVIHAKLDNKKNTPIQNLCLMLELGNSTAHFNKTYFAAEGKKFLKQVTISLGLENHEISVNMAGDASGAEVSLYSDVIYIKLCPDKDDWGRGLEILYRGCKPSKNDKRARKTVRVWDYGGGMNNWTTYSEVASDYAGFLNKLRRIMPKISVYGRYFAACVYS